MTNISTIQNTTDPIDAQTLRIAIDKASAKLRLYGQATSNGGARNRARAAAMRKPRTRITVSS
jgi:hypothetical protein